MAGTWQANSAVARIWRSVTYAPCFQCADFFTIRCFNVARYNKGLTILFDGNTLAWKSCQWLSGSKLSQTFFIHRREKLGFRFCFSGMTDCLWCTSLPGALYVDGAGFGCSHGWRLAWVPGFVGLNWSPPCQVNSWRTSWKPISTNYIQGMHSIRRAWCFFS